MTTATTLVTPMTRAVEVATAATSALHVAMPGGSELPDLRLWQLISATLPVGGYSYSQGLEYAVHAGWVDGVDSLAGWLGDLAEHALCALELPILLRIHAATLAADVAGVAHWGVALASARETSEMRREDSDMAAALRRLLATLAPEFVPPAGVAGRCYVSLFAAISAHWRIGARAAAAGYLWSWAENQVAAATRLMPLGQSAAQRVLFDLATQFGAWLDSASVCSDDAIGFTGPGYMIASAAHETQYSRLFRS